MAELSNDWKLALADEFKKPYYKDLYLRVVEEYRRYTIFPPQEELFTAFHLTPLSEVKVVILGQDPYHNPGQAHGLSFSVKKGVEIPPSLRNMYLELEQEFGYPIPEHGCLEAWAEQGVLMLNTVLTVRAHQANSLRGIGWEVFTDRVIDILNEQDRPIVYLLWGRQAIEKAKRLRNPKHLVLTAPHPSPLSAYRGFLGCGHFKKANEFLTKNEFNAIDWRIQ